LARLPEVRVSDLGGAGADSFMERAFKRDIASVEGICAFISLFARRYGLKDADVFGLNLAIEEIFVNLVRYDPANNEEVSIGLEVGRGSVVARLRSRTARPFDPTKVGRYDINKPIEDRAPGGLGIHLVRSVMDDLAYEYRDDESVITLTRRTGKAYV
jgi:serine/threonine-protein kinase RsbW